MLVKTIEYTDYDGVTRKEKFYFNLSKAELTEMQLSKDGGFSNKLQRIVDAKDVPQLIAVFKEIIFKSYGIKSDDGRRFIKSAQISEEFSQTEAYSKLFMELITDEKAAANFANSLVNQATDKPNITTKLKISLLKLKVPISLLNILLYLFQNGRLGIKKNFSQTRRKPERKQ